jgi:glycosyltransferase involved in cell wall biosynthesis
MTILEAFSFGKPVIAYRIGGIPEFIRHGVDGLTYEAGNADELSACIAVMLDDPQRLQEMGRAGRLKMETELSVEEHHKQLMELYNALISG